LIGAQIGGDGHGMIARHDFRTEAVAYTLGELGPKKRIWEA
jgi:hypothetical protein